jgi:hypothetical protein
MVPTLTAFVGVLGLLSVDDLVGGRVDVARLLSHTIVVVGYVVVLVMSRPGFDRGVPPAGGTDTGSGWRASFEAEPEARVPPRLRLVAGRSGHLRVGYNGDGHAAGRQGRAA